MRKIRCAKWTHTTFSALSLCSVPTYSSFTDRNFGHNYKNRVRRRVSRQRRCVTRAERNVFRRWNIGRRLLRRAGKRHRSAFATGQQVSRRGGGGNVACSLLGRNLLQQLLRSFHQRLGETPLIKALARLRGERIGSWASEEGEAIASIPDVDRNGLLTESVSEKACAERPLRE